MKIVKLKDVAIITTGKTPSKADDHYYSGGTIPFVKPPNLIDSKEVIVTEEYLTEDGIKKANIIPKHSIMVSCIGSLGKIGIAGTNLVTNQQINSLTFNSELVDYKYGYYFSLTLASKLKQIANSAVVPIVNKTTFSNLDFILVSLGKQKKIAKILDEADALRQKRKQTIELLDNYLKSVFLDIFGNPVVNTKGWDKETLKFFGEIITGNTPPRNNDNNYSSNFIEWIKTDNIVEGKIYLTKASEYLSESGLNRARFVNPGAVLMACIAGSIASIGRVAITDRKVSFNQQINAIQPNKKVNSLFLYWLFRISRSYVQSHATKGMKRILTKGEFEKITMILPPIKLQIEFAKVVLNAENLKQKMLLQSQELDIQFQALMQKYFSLNS